MAAKTFPGDDRADVLDLRKGLYPFSGENAIGPNMVNVGLAPRTGSEAFREAVRDQWLPALEAFRPQLIYVSAGFDAHREDDMGNLALVDADYEWVTTQLMAVAQRHCQGRVISCLEGAMYSTPGARRRRPRQSPDRGRLNRPHATAQGELAWINITRPRCLPRVRSWCLPAQRKTAHPQPR